MSEQIRNIKGTKDLLRSESKLWLETEIIIHKEEGVQRYGWREEDGIWVKTMD